MRRSALSAAISGPPFVLARMKAPWRTAWVWSASETERPLSRHLSRLPQPDSIFAEVMIQAWQEDLPMSDYFWLREAQFDNIKPYFPLSHGVPRADDPRVFSAIIHVIRNGLPWRNT